MTHRALQARKPRTSQVPSVHGALASLVLAASASGCAHHHPAPVTVQKRVDSARLSGRIHDTRLKIVTFNIWGLPSWITGARSGRYEEIARELDRLDADIVLLQEVW